MSFLTSSFKFASRFEKGSSSNSILGFAARLLAIATLCFSPPLNSYLSSFCVVTNALRLNFYDMSNTSKDKPVRHKIDTNRLDAVTAGYFHKPAVPADNAASNIPLKENDKEDTTMKKILEVEGMMCEHCKAAVEKALASVDGVKSSDADLKAGTASVTLTSDVTDETLAQAVTDAGYKIKGIK